MTEFKKKDCNFISKVFQKHGVAVRVKVVGDLLNVSTVSGEGFNPCILEPAVRATSLSLHSNISNQVYIGR